MFTCMYCYCTFEEPSEFTETHGLDSPPYETWCGCPACSGAYVEAVRCDECGEWITGEYIKLKNGGTVICEDCYDVRDVFDAGY